MERAPETTQTVPAAKRVDRSLLVLIAGSLLLLVAGVAVTLAVTHRAETTYPAGSPPATVAAYLRLLQDGKVDQAARLTDFPIDAFPGGPMTRETFHQAFDGWSQRSHRVTLLRVDKRGTQASVRVEISSFSATPLGSSQDTSDQTFTLVHRHAGWRITGPPYLNP